jgi:LCP family protein required for cell wall assembly
MRRSVTILASISLIAAGCGGGEAELSTTSAPPSTTISSVTDTASAPSTSSSPATTTVDQAFAVVTTNLAGSPSNSLDAAITAVYEAALNPGQAVYATIPEGLIDQFADRPAQPGPHAIEGITHYGRIMDTDIVVAMIGDEDIVLAVGQIEEDRWEIVGAKLTSLDEPAWYGEGATQVLVIGSDARPGGKVEGHRADSVHILSAIPGADAASIVGIPRDTWVEVSYESSEEVDGMDKLTHTMASRGPEFTVEAVTTLTGVEIDGYLLTGFLGFQQLIDEFGGFFLNVPYRMNDIKSFSNLFPGDQHLNGTEALAFSRNRENAPGGDFGRSFNHGSVLTAILREAQELGGVEQVPVLLMIMMDHVQTDMTPGALLNMAVAAFEVDPELVPNVVVPGDTAWRSGRNVVILDDEAFDIFADIAEDGILEIEEAG